MFVVGQLMATEQGDELLLEGSLLMMFLLLDDVLADFVQIVDLDGSGGDAPILQVDVTGTGEAFVDVAVLADLNPGDQVSVMINSTTTSDIEII